VNFFFKELFLLSRLFLRRSGLQTCPEQNQESEGAKLKNQDQTQFIQQCQSQPEGGETQSKQPGEDNEQGSQLHCSAVSEDKSIFAQSSETSTSDFSLHNFQPQRTVSNIQCEAVSQSNAILGNVSLLLNDQLKHNTVSEKNNTSCTEKQASSGSNTAANPSPLVLMVNDKEMMLTGVPNPNIPVSLLQALKKDNHTNEMSTIRPGGANILIPNSSCPDAVKIGNPVMSTPFVPEFLSMAIAAPSPNPTPVTGCGNSNVPVNSESFHWDVSFDMQNHDHNDSITGNVSASQDTIESIQRLLFGPPSAQM